MATLGLACIVKNEEQVLDRLLQSVHKIVDQIVIVDTGSTDKTIEIAKSYQAEVYHFQWIDDFAAARNESFKHITTDYILWLDADDVIYPEDAEKIKELIQNPEYDQYLLTYHYAHNEYGMPIMSFLRERIIKRSLNIQWEDPIHEYLPLMPNCKERADIAIHHFKTKENAATTAKRNIRLLQLAVEKNPTKARLQFYYAKELYDDGQHDLAEKEFLKYFNMPGDWEINHAEAYRKLTELYLNRKDFEKALDSVEKALKIEKKKADLFCLKGLIYFEQKNYQEAILWYEKAIYAAEVNNWGFNQMDYHTWIPHLQLCLCYYNLDNKRKSNYHNEKALEYRPNDERMLSNKKLLEKELSMLDQKAKEQIIRDTIIFYVPYGKSGGIKRIIKTAERLAQNHQVEIYFKLWGDFLHKKPTETPFQTTAKFKFTENLTNLNTSNIKHIIACEWYLVPEIKQLSDEIIKSYYCLGNPYKIWPTQQKEIKAALTLPGIFKLTSSRNLQQLFKNEQTQFVERIPSPIDLNLFTIDQIKIAKSVGMIYNPSEIKNCAIALKALKALKEKDPEISIHLLGFDDLPKEYQSEFKFYKDLNSEQVAQVMKETQVWVIPSLTEGYSTIMLEGMAAGNVVVCADIPDFELIIDNFTGIRFPATDLEELIRRLTKLLNNPAKMEQIAIQAHQLVHSEANWNQFITRFEHYLNKITKFHQLQQKKIKIGWICPINKEFGPIRIRAHNIDRFLRSIGINSFFIVPLTPANIKDCDLYIASHCYDLSFLQRVKDQQKPLILDLCEDIFKLQTGVIEATQLADCIVCCSTKLAEITKEYNSNVVVIEDAIEIPANLPYQFSTKQEKLIFGWVGYANNFQWAEPIKTLINEMGHELLTIHEQDKKLGDLNFKWNLEYYQTLLTQTDILIVPSNNELQPAKSNNKLTTFLALGKPVITDARPSHLEVFKQNGAFYIAQKLEDWKKAITDLTNAELRKKMGISGKLKLKDQYIEEIGLHWVNLLNSFEIKQEQKNLPQTKQTWLNVGCGVFKLPNFINLDVNPKHRPDILGDATDLHQFADNSIDLLFSSHTLEHLSIIQIKKALAEFYRVLKPGGRIDIILPDSERVARYYIEGKCDLQTFENWALGGGDHKTLFTEQRLCDLLTQAGFKNVAPFSLENYPWVIVPDIKNPKPEPYHCSARGFKTETKRENQVDIIIPTVAGNEKYLLTCLQSIQKNTTIANKITIVQSGSSKKLDLSVENYYAFEQKLNFAQAINYAIEQTSSPYIVLLNDDTIVTENWLENLFKGLNKTRKIVSPYSNCDKGWVHTDELRTPHLNLIPKMKLEEVQDYLEEIQQFKSNKFEIRDVDWVAFYATLFDRTVFDQVGLLNEKFESGGEDVDFCRRARQKGYAVGYNFNSFVFHFGAVTRGDNQERDQYNFEILKQNYKNRSITFYAGPAWEKWTPQNINRGGIGGSETMLAKVALEFAKIGFKVKVFNDCQELAGFYNGVEYLHHPEFEKYTRTEKLDIFVSSRVPWIFGLPIQSNYNICWVHDIWLGDQKTNIYSEKVHKYFVLSPWHQQFFCDHHNLIKEKTHITKNGIDLLKFKKNIQKEKNRLIYSSSPDRGLDVLLTLFPKIKQQFPDCSLHVYYGFDNWKKSIETSGNQQQKRWMESILNLMQQEGVIYHGRVGQQQLAEEFEKSSLWAYPTAFSETFAITALEAMAAGTPIICSDYAGLSSTVGEAGYLIYKDKFKSGDNYTLEYQTEFLEGVFKLLTNKQLWESYQQKGFEKVKNYTYKAVVDDWLNVFKNEKIM